VTGKAQLGVGIANGEEVVGVAVGRMASAAAHDVFVGAGGSEADAAAGGLDAGTRVVDVILDGHGVVGIGVGGTGPGAGGVEGAAGDGGDAIRGQTGVGDADRMVIREVAGSTTNLEGGVQVLNVVSSGSLGESGLCGGGGELITAVGIDGDAAVMTGEAFQAGVIESDDGAFALDGRADGATGIVGIAAGGSCHDVVPEEALGGIGLVVGCMAGETDLIVLDDGGAEGEIHVVLGVLDAAATGSEHKSAEACGCAQ